MKRGGGGGKLQFVFKLLKMHSIPSPKFSLPGWAESPCLFLPYRILPAIVLSMPGIFLFTFFLHEVSLATADSFYASKWAERGSECQAGAEMRTWHSGERKKLIQLSYSVSSLYSVHSPFFCSIVSVIILLPIECRLGAYYSPATCCKIRLFVLESPPFSTDSLPESMWTSRAEQSEDASMQQRADL